MWQVPPFLSLVQLTHMCCIPWKVQRKGSFKSLLAFHQIHLWTVPNVMNWTTKYHIFFSHPGDASISSFHSGQPSLPTVGKFWRQDAQVRLQSTETCSDVMYYRIRRCNRNGVSEKISFLSKKKIIKKLRKIRKIINIFKLKFQLYYSSMKIPSPQKTKLVAFAICFWVYFYILQ